MNFKEYQKKTTQTRLESANNQEYLTLGLCGEAGEVAEKVKKAIRDGQSPEFYREVQKELGDILWYIANLADFYNLKLEDIAQINVMKVEDRKARGTIKGNGDNR